ncbi:MAG: 2-iminoacetate synthase ThiH [Desulfobulbaceae bacterium]|nr:2-iminoacetate synthase ThiH [Desulfobulbaceae bacterium]
MFVTPEFESLRSAVAGATEADVRRALESIRPGERDLAALLSPAAEPFLAAMASRSAAATGQRFGKTIQIYAPLYVSNLCANRCLYCGFSAENRIDRRALSLDEAEAEAVLLQKRGFNHLLLVSGEAPAVGVEYLEALALRLRDRFAAISIEVQPLETEGYARLFRAGITGVAVYQETYDRVTYGRMHPAGPKSDYVYRLATPARGAAAGLREVGIGFLLGLSDWRAEGLAVGLHLAWLRKAFWRTAFTVSFPRMRPAAGGFQPPQPVNERQLTQLLFALRIFDPDLGLVLSTREDARYRDGMIGLGPTRYSAGSCTAPGGYGSPDGSAGEQFSVGDHRSIDEVCAAIRAKGFDPVRKDWDAVFQQTAA